MTIETTKTVITHAAAWASLHEQLMSKRATFVLAQKDTTAPRGEGLESVHGEAAAQIARGLSVVVRHWELANATHRFGEQSWDLLSELLDQEMVENIFPPATMRGVLLGQVLFSCTRASIG